MGFGGESTEEQAVTGDILGSLANAGLRITDDGLDVLSTKLGFPIERAPNNSQQLFSSALSATTVEPINKLPSVARREARKKQARRASEAVIASASPQLAKLLNKDFEKYVDALEQSTSAEDALVRLNVLMASYDPTEASLLIEHTLTAASVNGLIPLEHHH